MTILSERRCHPCTRRSARVVLHDTTLEVARTHVDIEVIVGDLPDALVAVEVALNAPEEVCIAELAAKPVVSLPPARTENG